MWILQPTLCEPTSDTRGFIFFFTKSPSKADGLLLGILRLNRLSAAQTLRFKWFTPPAQILAVLVRMKKICNGQNPSAHHVQFLRWSLQWFGGFVTYIASLHSTIYNFSACMENWQESNGCTKGKNISEKIKIVSLDNYWVLNFKILLNFFKSECQGRMSICKKRNTHVHIVRQYWWWSELVM